MSLSGAFATMPFPDLLQWLGDSQRSGVLTVTLEFEERHMRLESGGVVAFGSDDPRSHDLIRLLLGRKLIDEPRLRRAVATAEAKKKPLRTILVDEGHVPRAALTAALRAFVKDAALQLFLWQEGRFLFSDTPADTLLGERELAAELIVDPPLPVRELLIDGMRRVDEWRRVAEVLPSDYTVVHALGTADDLAAYAWLAAKGEPVALGDLILELGRPRFEILDELYEAWRRGLLAVEGVPQQIKLPRNQSPTDVLAQNAQTLCDEKQFDEAAILLRSVLDLDPYHEKARVLLHRARGEQLDELYRQFPPYKVPVCKISRDSSKMTTLTPRERYLVSRIDGKRDVAALTVMTPIGELETLRALKKFVHAGVVAMR